MAPTNRPLPETPQEDTENAWRQWMLFFNAQRTHLANERKFLAWIRTALALVTIGFVIQRLELFIRNERPAAEHAIQLPSSAVWIPPVFFGLAGLTVVIATYDFFADRRSLQRGARRVSGPLNVLVVTLLLAVLLGAVVLLIPSF